MREFFPALSACWLGLLTALSPCPLTASLIAVSYISGSSRAWRTVLRTAMAYATGVALVYFLLALLVLSGVMASTWVSFYLQQYMPRILGPLLIVQAMVLLGLFHSASAPLRPENRVMQFCAEQGRCGAFLLGAVLALCFCPTTAALYFGSLLPLCVHAHSRVLLPLVYALMTVLPVLLLSLLTTGAVRRLNQTYASVCAVEVALRRGTGLVFLIAGLYYTVTRLLV